MSIKTNELGSASSLALTDSFVVNTSSGTQKATVDVVQDAMLDVIHSGGVPYGKELTDSWTTLHDRIAAGDFEGIRIGDYKTITLTTGEKVILEVAGIDQYYKCGDTSIGHHIDFISRDCLNTLYQMNTTNINNGTETETNPWRASALFTNLNDTTSGVITTLPTELQNIIIEKRALLERRYSASETLTSSTGWDWLNSGKLWLPTEMEVWGAPLWGCEWTVGGGCNKQYPIFMGNSKHLIKHRGNGGSTRYWWWCSTTHGSNSTQFCGVHHTGTADYYGASHSGAVPLCCRVG